MFELINGNIDNTNYKPQVNPELEGEQKDVPVMYANQERWVNARKNNFMKDRNNAIVLPLIIANPPSIRIPQTCQKLLILVRNDLVIDYVLLLKLVYHKKLLNFL